MKRYIFSIPQPCDPTGYHTSDVCADEDPGLFNGLLAGVQVGSVYNDGKGKKLYEKI